jgi:Inositol 1,4,5-trisphosphate/ryanodine receptor
MGVWLEFQEDMVCLSCTATGERVCLAAEGFGNRHCFLENIADKVSRFDRTACDRRNEAIDLNASLFAEYSAWSFTMCVRHRAGSVGESAAGVGDGRRFRRSELLASFCVFQNTFPWLIRTWGFFHCKYYISCFFLLKDGNGKFSIVVCNCNVQSFYH